MMGGFMSARLFVGNLAYDVTEADLKELFSAVGSAPSVRIPTDRETGKSRGFAFVEFGTAAEAEEAVRRFQQQLFKGRPLVVNEARPREEGGGPRPYSSPRPSIPSGEPGMDRPPRAAQPTRVFGPDAAPRNKRRSPKDSGPRKERGPKGPVKERRGGQFFAGGVDDSEGDPTDDVAFWARAQADAEDEK
jgi:RNA recognition motif-containing protein